jgi:tetratricopeptide (TPR) repeat protein
MDFNITVIGLLEFANLKSFTTAINLFNQRAELYYKNDILTKSINIFNEENLRIEIGRSVYENCTEKSWKNTTNLLKTVSEYAIYGKIDMWKTNQDKKVLDYQQITPETDKGAVLAFNHGRKLTKEIGKEDEALELFNQALEKYSNHAFAYERRGFTNYKLEKLHDAINDFNKSNKLFPNAHSFIGLAHVYIKQKNYNQAIEELEKGMALSIPLMPTFWTIRRLKGECFFKNNQFPEAINELKFFVKRVFDEKDTNFKHKLNSYILFAKANFELGNNDDAVKALIAVKNLQPNFNFESNISSKYHPIIYKYEELVKIESLDAFA